MRPVQPSKILRSALGSSDTFPKYLGLQKTPSAGPITKTALSMKRTDKLDSTKADVSVDLQML